MDEVITLANNASFGEQVFSGLLFVGFVYYFIWIPVRDKRAGLEVPNMFVRVKNDLVNLFNKIKN